MKIEIEYKPVQHRINVKGVPCQHVRTAVSQGDDGRQYATCKDCKEDWEE